MAVNKRKVSSYDEEDVPETEKEETHKYRIFKNILERQNENMSPSNFQKTNNQNMWQLTEDNFQVCMKKMTTK